MHVFIGSDRVRLDDKDLLGVGGEGRVYRCKSRAVKVYHAASDGYPETARALALAKVRAFPARLPSAVIAPLELVHDGRGEVLGFTMPVVERATAAQRLGQRRSREGAIANAAVLSLFARLRDVLRALHARSVVVGDMNDGNVLFTERAGELTPWLIDADSMQFARFPCPVGHERFLDPRLYGVDLASRAAFDPGSDWFAFAVMLFSSLLYVHPYGGAHPQLRTMLRRAEARHSVLRGDVVYPRAAAPLASLPDAWLEFLHDIFDGDRRDAPPDALFDTSFVRCSCGVEHARSTCPACAARVRSSPRASDGACRAAVVLQTRGRVLAAVYQAGLRYLVEEDGRVVREDGHVVLERRARADDRFVIAGPVTWVAEADRVTRIGASAAQCFGSVATFDGVASFDAGPAACVAVVGDWLVDLVRGNRIGQVLEGQTWLRLGESIGFGFYRAGSIVEHFVFQPGRGGLTRVALPAPRGRVLEVSASFDGERVLFARSVDRDGRRVCDLFVIGAGGRLLASMSGTADDDAILVGLALGARCLAHGAMLASTEGGLMLARVDADARRLVSDRVFPETREPASLAVELLPAPGGSVYAITTNAIIHILPSAKPVLI